MIYEKQLTRRTTVDDSQLSDVFHPLLKQLYARRGVKADEEVEKNLTQLADYRLLSGIDSACELLYQAILNKKRILIIGDYDTDGATSTAVAMEGLAAMGAVNLSYMIPNRFEHGYGLSIEIVQQTRCKQPDLLITVDNGISSIEGVEVARLYGMDVLVTDHHLPGETLPNASVIVNPNLPDCQFPSKNLAGVGVIFYIMLALRAYLREKDWFNRQNIPEPNLAKLLDLVALGTVADVVPLDRNNRIFVAQGLHRMRSGKARCGIKTLIEVAGCREPYIISSDLGYFVAPRLNAAGRLDNMNLGVELLLSQDEKQAKKIAIELDALNNERREIERSMEIEALAFCQEIEKSVHVLPDALAFYHQDWHQGVVGIVASRIKDRFNRPVIAFAPDGEHMIKGSGRSITDVHLRNILEEICTSHPDLIGNFGGHAMAAGLSMKKENFEQFQRVFSQTVSKYIDHDKLNGVVVSDGPLPTSYMNINVAHILRYAGPWGQMFPTPVFDGQFKIIQQRLVGERHLKLIVEPLDGGDLLDAIAFNIDTNVWPDPNITQAHLTYQLDINYFRGEQSLKLLITHLWGK